MRPPALLADLLDLFLPRGCLGCGDRIPPEEAQDLVCAHCRILLRPPVPPRCPRCDVPLGTGHPTGVTCLECQDWPGILVSARAAVVLESPASDLVHALKYGGWRSLGELMGSRMAALVPPPVGDSVVVPVPTTPRRRRMRGYNQARVLAEVVARELGIPLVGALDRPGGRTQVSLGLRERKSNVMGSFRIHPSFCSRISGSGVILVDDVLTTGATACSAALALAEGGVDSVALLTFARALPFGYGEARTLVA